MKTRSADILPYFKRRGKIERKLCPFWRDGFNSRQPNPDEIYILLMGASLHDVGMGISENDFKDMYRSIPSVVEYMESHPGEVLAEYTRVFHHEFSAQFIKKYSNLFEIPTSEHIYCIAQVARGHRTHEIIKDKDYVSDFRLKNGNTVNLAFITALVKLADELDVTSDRNLLFNYSDVNGKWSKKQTMCYKCHGAIKKLSVDGDTLVLHYDTDDDTVESEILKTRKKVERAFADYKSVVEKTTDFNLEIKSVIFKKA